MLTCGSQTSSFLSSAPPTPACHMRPSQPLQSADLSPSPELTWGASAKGTLSLLSQTQAPYLSPPPIPFLCPLSCKLPSSGAWGFLAYEFPSLFSLLPHTYTHTQFLPFFPLPVFKGL